MTKPRIRYGILDDFGEGDKPSKLYKYVTQRVRVIDWSDFEPAPY